MRPSACLACTISLLACGGDNQATFDAGVEPDGVTAPLVANIMSFNLRWAGFDDDEDDWVLRC